MSIVSQVSTVYQNLHSFGTNILQWIKAIWKHLKSNVGKIILLNNRLTLRVPTELIFLRIHLNWKLLVMETWIKFFSVGLVAYRVINLIKKENFKIGRIYLLCMMYCDIVWNKNNVIQPNVAQIILLFPWVIQWLNTNSYEDKSLYISRHLASEIQMSQL